MEIAKAYSTEYVNSEDESINNVNNNYYSSEDEIEDVFEKQEEEEREIYKSDFEDSDGDGSEYDQEDFEEFDDKAPMNDQPASEAIKRVDTDLKDFKKVTRKQTAKIRNSVTLSNHFSKNNKKKQILHFVNVERFDLYIVSLNLFLINYFSFFVLTYYLVTGLMR